MMHKDLFLIYVRFVSLIPSNGSALSVTFELMTKGKVYIVAKIMCFGGWGILVISLELRVESTDD